MEIMQLFKFQSKYRVFKSFAFTESAPIAEKLCYAYTCN